MNKSLLRLSAVAASAAALSLGSCIDHDYDLKEDNLDLKVTVGGELLTLPTSSVQELTLSQILELDVNSSIKEMTAQGVEGIMPGDYGLALGDYLLLQDGDSKPADYLIEEVEIDEMEPNVSHTALPQFIGTGSAERITRDAQTINEVRLTNDNVTTELISLDRADLHVVINFTVGFESSDFSGNAYIDKGYTASFNPSWTVEPIGETADYLEQVDGHTLRFKDDYQVSATHSFVGRILLKSVDFTNPAIGEDQGIYTPGKFRLNNDVETEGEVSIASAELSVGTAANLTLVTSTVVEPAPRILSVTGVVDPEIKVDPTSFAISDIPDFLNDNGNSLDIDNPVIEFTVTNNSPLSINVNGKLTSYVDRVEQTPVGIGDKYGTKPVIVKPNTTMVFRISRKKLDDSAENIVVPGLGDIIKTIPDEILFSDIDCKAVQASATYKLGHTYSFSALYKAIIPLAFGSEMRLHYPAERVDMDTDLDKYNFDEVLVTLDAVNSIPMKVMPSVTAVDKLNRPIPNVKALIYTVLPDGTDFGGYDPTLPTDQRGEQAYIAAGTTAGVTTPIKIVIKSLGENIANLDGIEITFDAESGDAAGVNLNSAQSLKLNDIKIQIRGGITVDLRSDD